MLVLERLWSLIGFQASTGVVQCRGEDIACSWTLMEIRLANGVKQPDAGSRESRRLSWSALDWGLAVLVSGSSLSYA